MPHDKIRDAARKRMAETGESYTAARRAVLADHQGGAQVPSSGADYTWGEGYTLRMSAEIHDWLADLRSIDARAAIRVTQALVALMEQGPGLGDPMVVGTAGSWPGALAESLDRSWRESMQRLTAVRRGAADADALVEDIEGQIAELEAAEARLADRQRAAMDGGSPEEAARMEDNLALVRHQLTKARRLLPTVTAARDQLGEAGRQLQRRIDVFHGRKEVLKASYVAAQGRLKVREAIADMFPAGDDGGQQVQDANEATSAAEALAAATAAMERALGQESWPEGLMELRPGAPVRSDIRILFGVEPPRTVLAIAVLEDVGQFAEALLAAADMLRLVRAGGAPEASVHGYDSPWSFVQEFYPEGA